MTHLVFSPAAQEDLLDIADYIARDDPRRARSFASELVACCTELAEFPEQGRSRPELAAGLRSRPFGRYVIFYVIAEPELRIQRILHGARDIGAVFQEPR